MRKLHRCICSGMRPQNLGFKYEEADVAKMYQMQGGGGVGVAGKGRTSTQRELLTAAARLWVYTQQHSPQGGR